MRPWFVENEIQNWFVVFWPKNPEKFRWFHFGYWADWWAIGGWRHVSAFGYSVSAGCWVHVNPEPNGMNVRLIPDGQEADAMVATLLDACCVINVPFQNRSALLSRGPFTCVTAIKHLAGIRCGALGPSAFRRYLLTIGTEIGNDNTEVNSTGCDPA